MSGSQHIHRNADEIQHDRRNIQHVVRPVAPAGKKSVEVSEDFLGPQINAAFSRIAMRQFNDRDSLRPKEEEERDNPQPNGYPAIRGNRWHNIQIENRPLEQQYQLAPPKS